LEMMLRSFRMLQYQAVSLAIVSSLTKLERGSIKMLRLLKRGTVPVIMRIGSHTATRKMVVSR